MTMKKQLFQPSWFFYPHTRIAIIVFSEEGLAEQEAIMGDGEYIREATRGEQQYQTSGIMLMVSQYFSIIAGAPVETTGTGLAS